MMQVDTDAPQMLYATSATKIFNPSTSDKNKVGRASKKYLVPKVINVNLVKKNQSNTDM
jgi:hypothetical protein